MLPALGGRLYGLARWTRMWACAGIAERVLLAAGCAACAVFGFTGELTH